MSEMFYGAVVGCVFWIFALTVCEIKGISHSLSFRWYDIWIGVYIDVKNSAVYICLVPTIVFKFWYERKRQ